MYYYKKHANDFLPQFQQIAPFLAQFFGPLDKISAEQPNIWTLAETDPVLQ